MNKTKLKEKIMRLRTWDDIRFFCIDNHLLLKEFDEEMLNHYLSLAPRDASSAADICEDPREWMKKDKKDY